MASKFGWVDFAKEDKQKMLDVVHLFRERDTRDELGIGTIRDAFADHFFPGTSTIQTRVKYMLFVPWIYMDLERKRVSTSRINQRARRSETRLIEYLLDNGEDEGVIGREARKNLQRLPSNIYWTGMASWGIRLYSGSQDQYHKGFDNYYFRQNVGYDKETDDEVFDQSKKPNWHPGLPAPPEDLEEEAELSLNKEEAIYLKDRVLIKHPKSFLAELINKGVSRDVSFPWRHFAVKSFPRELKDDIHHAQNFSEVIHGAFLLYNLMLSKKIDSSDWINKYEKLLHKWSKKYFARKNELRKWHNRIEDFWGSTALNKANIPIQTQNFVNRWFDFIFKSPGANKLTDSRLVQIEIANREVQLKRNRARLENKRALEIWGGTSGTRQLSYRWPIANSFVKDILDGLEGN